MGLRGVGVVPVLHDRGAFLSAVSRRLVLLILAAVCALPAAGGDAPRIDVTKGEVGGRSAVSFWASQGFGGEVPLPPEGCTAHLLREEPGADEVAVRVIPCGSWTVPDAGRYRYWIEAPGLISPAMNVFRFTPRPFTGKGTAAVRPVVVAGAVALAAESPWAARVAAGELHLRLLAVESHNQGEIPLPEMVRSVAGAPARVGVQMPVGPLLAGIWDPRRREYLALSRPMQVKPTGVTVVDPRSPRAASDLLAVVELARPAASFDELKLAILAMTGEAAPRRPPNLIVPSVFRVFAVWYGLAERRVSISADSPEGYLAPVEVLLRAGKVETIRATLAVKPRLEVRVEVPEGFAPRPGSAIVVLRLPDRQEVARLAVDARRSEYRFGPLTADRYEVLLDLPPVRVVEAADLSSGADAELSFALSLIRVAGTVFRGREPYPAKVTFRRFRDEDRYAVSAETDEDGDYDLFLLRPANYDIYVELRDREGPPFIMTLEPIEGDTLLDFVVPGNEFSARVVDEATGEGIAAATVMVVSKGRSFRLDPTAADGLSRLPPQLPGKVRLLASADGYEEGAEVALEITATDPGREVTIPLRKSEVAGTLRLLLPDGRPAAGAEAWAVAALSGNATPIWRGRAGGDGRLRLPPKLGGALLLVRHSEAGGLIRRLDLPGLSDEAESPAVTWTMTPGASPLAVQVERPGGEPAPWARVAVWIDGHLLTGGPLRWLAGADVADTRGSWVGANLPARPIEILAWEAELPGFAIHDGTRGVAATVPYPWRQPVRLTAVR